MKKLQDYDQRNAKNDIAIARDMIDALEMEFSKEYVSLDYVKEKTQKVAGVCKYLEAIAKEEKNV